MEVIVLFVLGFLCIVGGIFLGSVTSILLGLMLIIFGVNARLEDKPNTKLPELILPEEYQELKRGDTLIVEAVRDNKIYLMYPVKTE